MIKLDSTKQNIFFSADLHLYHKNITRGVSQWGPDRGCRDFDTIEEMTDTIIDGINKYVGEDDLLFVLGDWCFNGIDKIWEGRKRIKCRNIYFIAGNHDLKIIRDEVLPNCRSVDSTYQIIDESESTQVLDLTNQVKAQDLFNYRGTSDLVQIDKHLVYMSHFPCEGVRYDKRSFHIHGHVHGTYAKSSSRLDVGIDNAFKLYGEYRPFTWEEVKQILK